MTNNTTKFHYIEVISNTTTNIHKSHQLKLLFLGFGLGMLIVLLFFLFPKKKGKKINICLFQKLIDFQVVNLRNIKYNLK